MLYPSINELLDKVDSRYTLVMMVSKRARQLVDGREAIIESSSTKPVTVAVEEIADDKITYSRLDTTEEE